MDVVVSVSNGTCDREYAITNRPTPTRAFGWFRFNGQCDREPTTKAKRLICNDSVSNGPCDRYYAITNRPLRPLPLRVPIRCGYLREGGREKNNLTSPWRC